MLALIASILVTFPGEGQRLPPTDRVYVIGAAETNRKERLYLNGVDVGVYRTGAFIAMAKARPGVNRLEFAQGAETLVREFFVGEPAPSNSPAVTKPPRNPYADLGLSSNAVYAVKPPVGTPPSKVHIVVDAGHGGNDPGALTPRGFKEKDCNLKQAEFIAAALVKAGFKVTMTRSGDVAVPLYSRPKMAVKLKADALISVHHNATGVGGDPREARHTVTYASTPAGLALAAAIQKQVAHAVGGIKNLGAREKSLAVCRNPAVPSCLMEVDFVNLPEGEESSFDPVRMRAVANAVVIGVLDWINGDEN
jgi:N-acetylmuramoyl-L-alanine amidase